VAVAESSVRSSGSAGQEYHVAITFGAEGFRLYLDGVLQDAEVGYTQGIQDNPNPLAIGANIWGRSEQNPNFARDLFDGTITNLTIYDSQLSASEVNDLALQALADDKNQEPPLAPAEDLVGQADEFFGAVGS